MTVREKGGGRSAEGARAEVETVEVVSSSSVVEEARRIVESESRSSVYEVTSRELVTDSKGANVAESVLVPRTRQKRRAREETGDVKSRSMETVVEKRSSESRSSITAVNGAVGSSKSYEASSREESRTQREGDGRASSSRIRETSERLDENGRVTSTRGVESETVEAPRVKFAEEDANGREKERKRGGEVAARCNKPGQSAWDGTFVSEGREATREESCESSVEISSKDAVDFAGEHRKRGARRSRPGESAWDGTFVIEKTPEPRKRNVFDSTRVFIEEESGRRSKESRDGKVASPPRRGRAARPGESSWNGEFVREKGEGWGSTGERTVVRRSEKRHDSDVDVQDVTEEQNVSTVSESSVSSSYIVEYATATDERRKKVEKASSVSGAILEEDSVEGGEERKGARDTATRSYKPGPRSAWDGGFVYENASKGEEGRSSADHRSSIVIRDVTGDSSINEAEISTASYVVEHSSSQQSFTDVRDSSLSSVHETIVYDVVRPTDSSTRQETLDKIGKTTKSSSGSSTWDGTFVAETSTDRVGDGPVPRSRRQRVTDATLDVRDATERISKVFSNSIVMEQSTVHHSYSDSSNLDYSTSSVETVIVRDGHPAAVQKSVTIEEQKKLAEKSGLARGERPSKPGASAWDGSFVPEKPDSRRPVDRKEDLGELSKKDEQPTYVTEKSITVKDASKETSEFVTTTLERTLVSDASESHDSKYSTTIVREIEEPASRPGEKVDRSLRPSKPGASTWDGSFVREKPQDRSKRPIDGREKGPLTGEDGERPTSPLLIGRDATKISKQRDTADKKDSTDIDAARSSYVIDQSSSFTSVQDVRDVVEERVIGEFTRDTRKDVVSNE